MSRYFRDDEQSARACRTLLATANLERLWSVRGPTDEAHSLFASGGADLDTGARATFLVAWAFWSGEGALPLADVLAATNVEAICSLCVAVSSGPQAVDTWLTRVWFAPGYLDERNIHVQAAALFDDPRERIGAETDAASRAGQCRLAGAHRKRRDLRERSRTRRRHHSGRRDASLGRLRQPPTAGASAARAERSVERPVKWEGSLVS
jgi:hypothetical protein